MEAELGAPATSATYTVSFVTRGSLWTWQTSVSLLSLLTGGSDQADQARVTLTDGRKDAFNVKKTQRGHGNRAVTGAEQQQPGGFK